MQSIVRSLSTAAALTFAAVLCLIAGAAPQRPAPASEASPLPDVAPVSLSDPDGQELVLEDLSARAAIQGPLSLTELELRFRNPKPRRIEGRFTCTLPANAAISRFAKEVNGQLMEGEVVERLRANQVYESFLHQMRDPALLEQDQGNRFSARIFPIEANGTVRLLLSYSTLLPLHNGVRTWSLPLRGAPKIGHFAFRAFVQPLPGEETVGQQKTSGGLSRSTADVYSTEEADYTPQHDIELSFRPTASASRARILRAGDFYLAAFRPEVHPTDTYPDMGPWLFYVDTSASSAEAAEHRIRALEQILGALPPTSTVQVRAFDQEIVTLGSGTAAEMARSIGGLLRARLFLGGTDLGAVLRDIAKTKPSGTVVVASDFVATLGATDRKELNDAIKALPYMRLHALILGSREDAPTAKAITAGRGRVVRVPFTEQLDRRAIEAASALEGELGKSFDVADASAEWVYPTHFDDVHGDDELIVLGKTKAGAEPAARLAGAAATELQRSTLPAGTFGPLLEREGYRAYLDYLGEREANEPSEAVRRALATEQVRLSVEQRVVIPRTTMLVLETEWDYQRFGLDRRALASILTIDAGGIGRIDRRGAQQFTPLPPMPVPVLKSAPAPRQERDRATNEPSGAPAPVPAPAPADFDAVQEVAKQSNTAEAITVTSAAPVEGGVEGGTVGGVVGGVIGGAAPPPAPPLVTTGEPTAITAPRVPPPPAPAVPRPEPRPQREESDTSWTKIAKPTRDDVEELQAKLHKDPRDRELYNQLSEALAALGEWSALRTVALQWQPYDPENPQVYEVLGNADEHLGNAGEAARANASLIEVAPAKPELLQRAGLLLLRTKKASLAETPLRRALELRPDRVNSYRHLALMLWLDGRPEEAARVLESATQQHFPDWLRDVQRVVREELGYVYRAWMEKEPSRRAEIAARARDYAVDLDRTDALRVTLAWETDANDVDLHVVDPDGEESYYAHRDTKSGLTLYDDITQGFGPEVIRTDKLERGTYHIGVRYFSAGPMGVSRGIVVVMRGGDVSIYPFRLIEGGGEIRYVASVNVK